MPMSHEQAAIDAASGRRRERLIKAAALLDRIRAEHPGVENIPDLPAALRPSVRDASRAFRGDARIDFGTLVTVFLLAASVGGAYFEPVRAFRCEPQGEGLARCLIAERVFGVFTRDQRMVSAIARAEAHTVSGTTETRASGGQTTTSRIETEELSLFDASGAPLWSESEQALLGASFEQVERDVDGLRSGAVRQPVLRVQACWPILLISSLFTVLFFNSLARNLGLALRDRELIPAGLYENVFALGGWLLPLLVCGFAFFVVCTGSDPPAFVGPLLGIG